MADLNEDGLKPGQQVDFETLKRLQNEHAKAAIKEVNDEASEKPKGKAKKASKND